MKTIFIKDDRLRELTDYRCKKIVDLCIKGKIKGSYTIEESSKEYKTKKYPFYAIYFGWDVIDSEDGWKLKEHPEKDLERVISELKKAELQKDGTIKVNMEWAESMGTINYIDFRTFCDEMIKKILIQK